VSSCGTSGNSSTITTTTSACPCGFYNVTDVDGNTYNTVSIGTQCWLKQNLATTKYNDGTSIPNITDAGTWAGLTTAAYCYYNNNAATYKATYGTLYNWYVADNNAATKVASNGGRNVCPTGWHVPTATEFATLSTYLGGDGVSGAALKEAGTSHWNTPNSGATNSSGFTGLPAAYRHYNGNYLDIGNYANIWTTTVGNPYSTYRNLRYNTTTLDNYTQQRQYGFSIRCLKDQ
jgi:uncharacterized protein (TIGR02145 family)